MKYDGAVLIEAKVEPKGMEEGFRRIKTDMEGVAQEAQKVGNDIQVSFSSVDVSKAAKEASEKMEEAAQEVGKNVSEAMQEQTQKATLTGYQYNPQEIENFVADYVAGSDEASKHISSMKTALEEAERVVAALEEQGFFWDDEEYVQAQAALSRVKADIKEAQYYATHPGAAEQEAQRQIADAQKVAREKEKAADKAAKAEEEASKKVIKAAEQEAKAKKKAARKSLEEATKPMQKFESRLRSIVSGALLFNLVSSGLRELTSYFGKALKSNEAFTNAFGRLKGALLTAFQPIYETVLPALVSLMNVLTKAAQAVGRFFAALTGKSASQMADNAENLYNEANAIEGVGSAAKKAQKQLAGFDELNKLGSTKEDGGGGGGSGANIKPVFESVADMQISESLKTILGLALAIGAALAGWKIASAFTDGLNWTSFAIGLLAAGIVMVTVAIYDWIKTGELSNEMCALLVGGITAIGVAISILTGSWIPFIIAAVVALVVLIGTKGDEIKALLQKLDDWLQNIFAKDWREVLGPGLGGALNGFLGAVKKVWDGVKKTFDGVIDFIRGVFTGDWNRAINGLLDIFSGIFETIKEIALIPFNKLAEAARNLARNVLPETWKAGINSVIAIVNRFINWMNKTLSFTVPPITIAGQTIFEGKRFSLLNLPQIPQLAKGAVLPPNQPFLAMLGDQRHGTNIEAPLSTIQEAVAAVMGEQVAAMMAGFEALLEENRMLRETVEGIEIGDTTIGQAADRYKRKMNVVRGGA